MAFDPSRLFGNVSSAVDEITGTPGGGSGGERKFRRFLREKHVNELGDTIDATTGDFTKVAQFTVPAQERYRWGYGAAQNPENQGYIYVDLRDDTADAAEIDGSVRIQQRDAQEREVRTVEELEIAQLRASKSDRSQMIPLPEQVQQPKVGRDSKLALSIDPDSDTTVDWTNSEVILPTAVYPVRNV